MVSAPLKVLLNSFTCFSKKGKSERTLGCKLDKKTTPQVINGYKLNLYPEISHLPRVTK